jgi:hypothetical protein
MQVLRATSFPFSLSHSFLLLQSFTWSVYIHSVPSLKQESVVDRLCYYYSRYPYRLYFLILHIMKSTILLLAAAAGFSQAKPNGMSHMMRDLSRRQAPPNQTVEMIGDLLTVGAVTPVGKQVKTCFEDASGATCVNNDKKVSNYSNLLTERCN